MICLVLVLVVALTGVRQAGADVGDPRAFLQTGYRIDDDAFFNYFSHRGGVRTFGYPISRAFTLQGFRVQLFQRQALQLRPDGSVGVLNLLDPGLLPYRAFNGAIVPAADASLLAAAPRPTDPTYARDALAFIAAHTPNTFRGMKVNFHTVYMATVRAADAFPLGEGDAALLPLFDLEVWGLPTSRPAVDPRDPAVAYLRFQRGVMRYDAATGRTEGMLLGGYLKALLTGLHLPSDLAGEAATSRLARQWAPGLPGALARPAALPATDLTDAFLPPLNPADPPSPTTTALASATPTGPPRATATAVRTGTPASVTPTVAALLSGTPQSSIGDVCTGDERMAFAGAGSAAIGDTVYIAVTASRDHTNVVLTGPDDPTFIHEYRGQEGYVWVYQVGIKNAGEHDYTFYIDTTTVCTANYFVVAGPTITPGPTNTPGPTATPTSTAVATPTVGPKPSITSINPTSVTPGQVITINGGPFGLPPAGSGASGTNGAVFFFLQPGTTPGPNTPTPTPVGGAAQAQGSVQSWTNGFIAVQTPGLAPSVGGASYCVQVSVNGAPTSDPVCGLVVSGVGVAAASSRATTIATATPTAAPTSPAMASAKVAVPLSATTAPVASPTATATAAMTPTPTSTASR